MTAIAETARAAERLGSEALAALLRAAAGLLSGERDAALPPALLARLHRDAWQMQARFDQLAGTQGIGAAIGDVTTVARDLGARIVALVTLIDTLIDEAERLHGTRTGRGKYKRQQVKAALLYAARRGGYDLPWVPSFLEPAVFSLGADLLIDFTVAHVNQNALWNRETAAASSLRSRLASPPILLLRHGVERVSAWLAGLAWRLVLAANQLSPGLRAIVDRVAGRDADALRALNALRAFVAANPECVTALAALFGIGTQQAETFVHLTGAEKQAYVRELVLIVLRHYGLIGESALLDHIVEVWVTVGIDATVAIFDRRGVFA